METQFINRNMTTEEHNYGLAASFSPKGIVRVGFHEHLATSHPALHVGTGII